MILGGGPVGCELAQAWQSLGRSVVLVEGGAQLLGREEPFASEEVEEALRFDGVDVRTGIRATGVVRTDSQVTITLDNGSSIEGDELLLALGRTPRTQGIGLDYAIGDVNGRALLTHQGKYQGRIAADHILGRANASLVYGGKLSPRIVTGAEVGDFLHAATIAIVGDVPLDRLAHAVPCFPSRSEVSLELLEAYGL